nr:MAG TPA: hypothetical protein [Caudoviricetes sp.]
MVFSRHSFRHFFLAFLFLINLILLNKLALSFANSKSRLFISVLHNIFSFILLTIFSCSSISIPQFCFFYPVLNIQ